MANGCMTSSGGGRRLWPAVNVVCPDVRARDVVVARVNHRHVNGFIITIILTKFQIIKKKYLQNNHLEMMRIGKLTSLDELHSIWPGTNC